MQDLDLSITHIFQHGRRIHADAEIITYNGPDEPLQSMTFAEIGDRTDQLAAALMSVAVVFGKFLPVCPDAIYPVAEHSDEPTALSARPGLLLALRRPVKP